MADAALSRAERKAARKAERLKTRLPWSKRLMVTLWMVLSGVFTFLSFPFTTEAKSNITALAWLSLIPLFWGLRGLTVRQSFWAGSLMGLVTNIGGFWWLSEVLRDFGHLPPAVYWPITVLNAGYQGLFFGIFAALYALFARKLPHHRFKHGDALPLWIPPTLWVALELIFPMLFPWYFGNSQYRFLPVIQISEITGVLGVSWVLVLANAMGYRLLCMWRTKPKQLMWGGVGAAAMFIASVIGYGFARIAQVEDEVAKAKSLHVGMVEADIGIFEKEARGLGTGKRDALLHENLLKHQLMSQELAAKGVDLIVWPESSYIPGASPASKRRDEMLVALGPDGLYRWTWSETAKNLAWERVPDLPVGPKAAISMVSESFVLLSDGARVRGFDLDEMRFKGESAVPSGRDITTFAAWSNPRAAEIRPYIWAIDSVGGLSHGELGEPLTQMALPEGAHLFALSLFSGRDGLVAGAGTLAELRLNQGLIPVRHADLAQDTLRATWASHLWGDAWAVGDQGVIYARRDGTWTRTQLPERPDLRWVMQSHDQTLWIAGSQGVVARQAIPDKGGKASPWELFRLPTTAMVEGLGIDSLGKVWASAEGALYRFDEEARRWERQLDVPAFSRFVASPWAIRGAFPRDVRWVRASSQPLPSLEAYRADPNIELRGQATYDQAAVQRGFQTPVLFGGLSWQMLREGEEARRALYNSAFLLDGQGRVAGRSDKVYLLAFGEYIPFGDRFPKLYELSPHTSRFEAGQDPELLHFGDHRLGVLICYEDILPRFTSKLARLNPQLLINITNDAWFGKTSEPWLHMALASFRAVETRKGLVRSTNTGVSAFVAPTGEFLSYTSIEGAETLNAQMPLLDGVSIYTRLGDFFGWLCLGFTVIGLGALKLRRVKPHTFEPFDPNTPTPPAAPEASELATQPEGAPELAEDPPELAEAPPELAEAPHELAEAPPELVEAPPELAEAPPEAPPELAEAPSEFAEAAPELAPELAEAPPELSPELAEAPPVLPPKRDGEGA